MRTLRQTRSSQSTDLRMCARSPVVLFVLLFSLFVFDLAYSQVPDSLSFQGFVTDLAGAPIDDPSVSMTFKLYQSSVEVWTETQLAVPVVDGRFDVILGSVTPIDSVIFDQRTEIGVSVEGDDEMTPRTILLPAPYALGVRGLDSLLHKIDQLEKSSKGFILGATDQTTDASVNFNGKKGIEGAHEMCQSSYNKSPSAHLCSYDELVRALGRGAVGDSSSYSGDWTWTASVGHDRSGIADFNTLSENTARSLLTSTCTTGAGSRLKVSFDFTFVDGEALQGTDIDIQSTGGCNSAYKLLCCL